MFKILSLLGNDDLLMKWKQERASRVVSAIAPAGIVLSIAAGAADLYYKMPMEVIFGNITFLVGTLISFYFARNRSGHSYLNWAPLYLGLWISCSTSLWATGGALSPFSASYTVLLFITGIIFQSVFRATYVTLFITINLVFWMFAQSWLDDSLASQPPGVFIIVINTVVIVGMVVCIYEFLRTEQSLAEEILAQYKKLATIQDSLAREETASAAKSSFLANISHELRTPLGAILGYAELIQDPATPTPEKMEFADTIRRNGQQLAHLVDDLLDLSKVEAEKIEIEKTHFNPLSVITEVYELLLVAAKKKGIDLRLNYRGRAVEQIISDPMRLKQILMNIIGNAIKFTEKGFVNIEVSYEANASGKTSHILKIEIQDTGRGISPEEAARLFKPFSQADGTISRKFGGTGLGLNLSRGLARLLGGDLTLTKSELGVGSCFSLAIPCDVLELILPQTQIRQTVAALSTETPPDSRLLNKKVLIVDDTVDNQRLIALYLEKAGVKVDTATNGFEGIQKATSLDFDLILMDVQMPILDGLQATTLLRQRGFAKPIIALTAHAMKEDRDRCLNAGFNDYLTKPVDRNLLIDKINAATSDSSQMKLFN